jgi:hypothetical protein
MLKFAASWKEIRRSITRDLFFGIKEESKKKITNPRKAAKKFNLDFEHRCCFRNQLNYKGLRNGNGEIVEVLMQSRKIGLYKVTSERYNYAFEDTGQRNWKFEFQGYKE